MWLQVLAVLSINFLILVVIIVYEVRSKAKLIRQEIKLQNDFKD